MEYYFNQLAYMNLKVPKRFVGLVKMQCSPSFDCNWGKQNNPTTAREMSQLPISLRGRSHRIPKMRQQ